MDFDLAESEVQFRNEVRQFIADEIPAGLCWIERFVLSDDLWPAVSEIRKKLGVTGWSVKHWPVEFGGDGATPILQTIFKEEMAFAGVPSVVGLDDGPNSIGPAIIKYGSGEMQKEHLPDIANGETLWCQGYTEPGSGSDLANVRTTAVLHGDHYIVNGQKDYISNAVRAGWIHFLARTSEESVRHNGISYFIADMKSSGITLRPLEEISGRSGVLCEVFFDDLRIPAKNLIGVHGGGWEIAMDILNTQRDAIVLVGYARRLMSDLIEFIKDPVTGFKSPLGKQELMTTVGMLETEIEVCRLSCYGLAWKRSNGSVAVHDWSMVKVLVTEMWQKFTDMAIRVLGIYGVLEAESTLAPLYGRISESYINSLATTIYLGASEIHRDIIARRGLGLPNA